MLEYNEMMSILLISQPSACHAEARGDEDQRRWVAPKPGEGGSTLSHQPSAELLQKSFDRMK